MGLRNCGNCEIRNDVASMNFSPCMGCLMKVILTNKRSINNVENKRKASKQTCGK